MLGCVGRDKHKSAAVMSGMICGRVGLRIIGSHAIVFLVPSFLEGIKFYDRLLSDSLDGRPFR